MDSQSGGYVSDQPTAPYLDAIVAYAFRGPGRYHVPGHKGGPGADPGVRKAIGSDGLAADVPHDIYGIDIGPSPTPYERAEQLARRLRRRRRVPDNGATQAPRPVPRARAAAPPRRPAQLARLDRDGLVLSGGRPIFFAPEYTASAASRTAAHRGARAGLASARARGGVRCLADYYAWPRVAGLAGGRAHPGMPLSRPGLGPHFG